MKKLEDCCKVDAVVHKIKMLSDKVDNLKDVILFILIMIGGVSSISMFSVNAIAGVSTLIVSALIVGIIYFSICMWIILLRALAAIVENTSITANVLLYTTSKSEPECREDDDMDDEDDD